MENICKDQVREMAELELPNEIVEVTVDSPTGCAEKIDIHAADHHFPSPGKIIHRTVQTRTFLVLISATTSGRDLKT